MWLCVLFVLLGTAQIFLGSWIRQPERSPGLSFPDLHAPLGFMTCSSSCQHFLLARVLISTVNVCPVTCRSPTSAFVVMAAADHTKLLFSVHHLNQSVVFLKIDCGKTAWKQELNPVSERWKLCDGDSGVKLSPLCRYSSHGCSDVTKGNMGLLGCA